jgi:hypothetical protein
VVVLRAANSWDGPWFADQQLAVALSKRVPVLYVDPAVSFLGRVPRSSLVKPWTRTLGPQLVRLSPVTLPAGQRRGVSRLTRSIVVQSITRTVRSSGARIEALIDCAPLVPVLGRCGELRRIFWAQDDFVAMAGLVGVSPAAMSRGAARLAGEADLIVASSPKVAEEMSRSGTPTALIPFGCDTAVFGRTLDLGPAPDVKLEGPVAGFMGHIGERIDVSLLDAVAAEGISVLLVGPRHPRFDMAGLDRLLARPNVQWVGPRPFEDLPTYLAAMDLGLVPYNHSPFNEASFPLKTLEYLAGGRPVVATDLPAIRWLNCPFIEVADSPTAFVSAVRRVIGTPRDRAARQKLLDFAAGHTWDARAAQFLGEIAAMRPVLR